MKKLLAFTLIFISFLAQTQISSGGIPTSFHKKKHGIFVPNNYQIEQITSPDLDKINLDDEHAEKNGKPYRVAVNTPVDLNIFNHGTWTTFEDGSKIWRLGIRIKDAKALGIYFSEKLVVPKGGQLFAYNASHTQFIGAYTNHTDDFTALEMVQGDEITLEYFMPQGQTILPNIKIKNIAYFYRGVGERMRSFVDGRPVDDDRADACQVDVACSEITGWEPQRDAVVKYTFVLGTGTFLCSGAIINNTAQDCTPFVLTANHCGEPTNSSDIQDHVWYFNYQRPTCSVGNTSPYNGAQSQTMSGGSFRASSQLGTHLAANNNQVSGSDFTLLELSDSIPSAYNVFYAGWTRTNAGSSSGVGIHHPSGDEKKISTYNTSVVSTTYNGGWSGAHWQVYWIATANGHGVTEGGSSGSPLFNTNGNIVGHLSGGSSFCSAPTQPDLYGKFNKAWNQDGTAANSQLKSWLDPLNTGVTELAGSYTPCASTGGMYCDASSVDCDEYISNFTIGGVSNSSSCNNYSLYWQGSPFEMSIGSSYYLQIATGIVGDTTIGYLGDQIGAWIDWNADGDFVDTGEQLYTHTIGSSTSIPLQTIVTVPPNAELGEARIRIRIMYDVANEGIISPCGTSNYGEVEDYVVNIIPSSLSINEFDKASSILIYPNPTSGQLYIDISDFSAAIETIEITDITGKIQFSKQISTSKLQLDLSDFAKGIYLVAFRTKGDSFVRKIIIE